MQSKLTGPTVKVAAALVIAATIIHHSSAQEVPLEPGNSLTFFRDSTATFEWSGTVTYLGRESGVPAGGVVQGGAVGASDISLLFSVTLNEFTVNLFNPNSFFIDVYQDDGIFNINAVGNIPGSGLPWLDFVHPGGTGGDARVELSGDAAVGQAFETFFLSVTNLPDFGQINFQGTGSSTIFSVPPTVIDADSDGIEDALDNCTFVPNSDQRDSNADGYGNPCDTDLNNDGITNAIDLGIFKAAFFTADADADFNGNGIVNAVDLGTLKASFFLPPGPSGIAP